MFLYLIEITAGALLIVYALLPFRTGNGSFWPVFHVKDRERKPEKTTLSYRIIIGMISLLFLFLIAYKADRIPMAYNVDEAATAYDAVSLVNYGVDRYLYKNPVYFINFGGGQNALYTYLAVLTIRLFGYSIAAVRLPAIFLAFISMLCFVLLVRETRGEMASVIAAGLFCVLPFSIMHSRWALESYLLFPMMIISCTVLHRAVVSGRLQLFAVSGLLLGITLYTYAISYVFLPVFLGMYFLFLLCAGKIRWNQLLAAGIPLLLLALPLMLMLAVNNGLIEEIRTPFFSIPKLPQYRGGEIGLRHILNNLKLSKDNILYSVFFNDRHLYNSIPKFGTLYYVSLPLILLGFLICLMKTVESFREKTVSSDLMMMLMFFAALGTTLMVQEINVNRACELYVPLIWFLTAGLQKICSKRRSAAVAAAVIYLGLGALFIRYYFNEFPKNVENNYGFASITDMEKALAYAESMNPDRDPVYVIGKNQPYISVILALRTDPYTFNEKKVNEGLTVSGFDHYRFMRHLHWDDIPDKPIYIFRDVPDIPWRMDLKEMDSKQFGTVKVYYSPLYHEPLPAE